MSSKLKLINLWIVLSLLMLAITGASADDVDDIVDSRFTRSRGLTCAEQQGECMDICNAIPLRRNATDCRPGQICCVLV